MYAFLGVMQAVFSFIMGLATSWIGYNVSRAIHYGAIQGILHAPMSFFDTTPLGRITNRFSKDIDTIDNVLTDSFRMFMSTLGSVVGSIVLIAIVQQWFLLVVAVILCLYAFAASFYRERFVSFLRFHPCEVAELTLPLVLLQCSRDQTTRQSPSIIALQSFLVSIVSSNI